MWRRFNERTGTPFNHLEFPIDIVFQVIVFRLLFKVSLRGLVRLFRMRGLPIHSRTSTGVGRAVCAAVG
jgi:hypothetical protein